MTIADVNFELWFSACDKDKDIKDLIELTRQ